MQIIRNDQRSLVGFQTLKIGDVFVEDCDGSQFVQMKIPAFGDATHGANAVLLSTGETYWLEPDCRVLRVDAILTIE